MCKLNQFVTMHKRCRRCHWPIDAAPVKSAKREEAPIVEMGSVASTVGVSIGAVIFNLRQAQQISQRILAHRICCPLSYISKIEKSVCVPNLSTLRRFASALGVSTAFIVEMASSAEQRAMCADPFLVEIMQLLPFINPAQRAELLSQIRQRAEVIPKDRLAL
jgi:transcriptional regulator with XRE-family HTH domain